MKSFLASIFITVCSFTAIAQDTPQTVIIDSSRNSDFKLEVPETPDNQSDFPNFKFGEDKDETIDLSPDREISMEPQERFANENDLFMKRLKGKLPEGSNDDENKRQGSLTTQYFGDIRHGGESVTVVVRDHQYQDGDLVSIAVNEEVKQERVFLTNKPKGFKLTLKPGFNKIDFTALNQGSSGPNTAEFRIYDENSNLISINQWNLATGVEATIVIVKE